MIHIDLFVQTELKKPKAESLPFAGMTTYSKYVQKLTSTAQTSLALRVLSNVQ